MEWLLRCMGSQRFTNLMSPSNLSYLFICHQLTNCPNIYAVYSHHWLVILPPILRTPVTFLTQRLGEEILVSFDVVSLFTKVPIELAIHVAKERLQEDNTLEDRTALSINEIIQLLEFCLKATYFSFRGKYYQQIFGTAMGSPVFVVVADMVMENIEQRALNSFSHPLSFGRDT